MGWHGVSLFLSTSGHRYHALPAPGIMGSTGKHIEPHETSAGRQPGTDLSRGDKRLPRHTSHPVMPASPKQTPNPKKPTRADYATDVIYAMDDKGGITMVNRAISTLGYTQEEIGRAHV